MNDQIVIVYLRTYISVGVSEANEMYTLWSGDAFSQHWHYIILNIS